MTATAVAFLGRFPTVFLDFDGPICPVFSSFTSAEVADALRDRVGLHTAVLDSTDPFDVLRVAAQEGLDAATKAERSLAELEVEAAASAEPTPGAFELIRELAGVGRRVAVVSNNSADAVRTFLEQHELAGMVAAISARTEPDPSLLKPHPYLVDRACALTRSPAHRCVLVGDSLSDMEAASRFAVAFIGYANKPGKREAFEEHGAASVVVDRIDELLTPRVT